MFSLRLLVSGCLLLISASAFAEPSLKLKGGGTVSVDGDSIFLTLPEKYRFSFDDDDAKQFDTSDSLSDFMNRYSSVFKLEVSGHTDSVGSDGYNMRLGMRRAESVSDRLMERGVSNESLVRTTYGSEIPALSKAEDKDKEDRRAELELRYVK